MVHPLTTGASTKGFHTHLETRHKTRKKGQVMRTIIHLTYDV